jgi:hypothetical protein
MQALPIKDQYGDLEVLRIYRFDGVLWARCRCVRKIDGKPCGRERKVEAKRLRQTNSCSACASATQRSVRHKTQAGAKYRNGEPLVTPGNYLERWRLLSPAQSAEVSHMIAARKLTLNNEWEAVEAVVMMIGVKERRPIDLPPSTDFSWMYRG